MKDTLISPETQNIKMNSQHESILAAAAQMGIECVALANCGEHGSTLLRFQGQEELVSQGYFLSLVNSQQQRFCDNKQLTKSLFSELGIPSPASRVFRDAFAEAPNLGAFLDSGKEYVCKPLVAEGGEGVKMRLRTLDDVQAYWRNWHKRSEFFLIEEQVSGGDLRLQAVGGELVAACVRHPAFVVGDGFCNISELIEQRRKVIQQQNARNRLDIDSTTLDLLGSQGLSLDSIPASGVKVTLKTVANMNQGALAVDVTDEIDPIFKEWVRVFGQRTGMDIFALDLVVENHCHYKEGSAWAIEVNAFPEWFHHTFSDRRQHDIPSIILRHVFGIRDQPGKG